MTLKSVKSLIFKYFKHFIHVYDARFSKNVEYVYDILGHSSKITLETKVKYSSRQERLYGVGRIIHSHMPHT